MIHPAGLTDTGAASEVISNAIIDSASANIKI